MSYSLFSKGAALKFLLCIYNLNIYTFSFLSSCECPVSRNVRFLHTRNKISLPSVKYFVILLVGSAAQPGLGFILGQFLCLCALDRMFDSIVGKVYVRLLPQMKLIYCGCLLWSTSKCLPSSVYYSRISSQFLPS